MEQPEIDREGSTGPPVPGAAAPPVVRGTDRPLHDGTVEPIITSLGKLPRQPRLELGTHGAILYSCAENLESFSDLRGASRFAVQAAGIELRIAVQDAAARSRTAEEALELAVGTWSEQLGRLASLRSQPVEELQLLGDLRRSAAQAQPTDPFGSIFEHLAGRARALYDDDWPPVEFIVRVLDASPPGDSDYAVRAETECAHTHAPITVVLKIHPPGFGPEAFAAIPALLVHEVVCHVASRASGAVDNLSIFAEGFMDWAADYYRQVWLPDLGPLALPAEEHGRRVFEAIARAHPGCHVARALGRRAARKLAQRLARHHQMSLGSATVATARLAVTLNVAPAPLLRKDGLGRHFDRQRDNEIPAELLKVIRGEQDPMEILQATSETRLS